MKQTATINLADYQLPDTKLFNTRSWGIRVRHLSGIDELALKNDYIQIIVPEFAKDINTPFFEELLINVIVSLGKMAFKRKFIVTNQSNYYIQPYLDEAIRRILRVSNFRASRVRSTTRNRQTA